MDRLAHKCVSLQFLLEFCEKVVRPYRPTMTVKEVVDEIIKPATKDRDCSFIDQLRPNMYVVPHAFISHAFGNPFTIIVESLKSYFKDAIFSEVYVWIDVFIINQHRPGDDLHDGLTLKATIEVSGSVVVCLDKNTLPLFRLWCLYEIGSTPIEKLVLLTHGFDASELGQAYAKIDSNTADCWEQSDKDMIREHIRVMMVEQKVVDSAATVEEALTAFTRVLKLLLLLKPTSYSADISALLARAGDYQNYPIQETMGRACTGGRLVCIVGGSGEGKSTLAAALWKKIRIDAAHFCKKADIRRQDRGLVIRSLSYQLAIRYPAFAQPILDMASSQVESLSDEAKAWELLLEAPLKEVRDLQLTFLIDALDESGEDYKMIALIVKLSTVLGDESKITFIVTTRPEPALLNPLRSHWKGERYQECSPSELRGEGNDSAVSPLLRTLIGFIQQRDPTAAAPADLSSAYAMIFDREAMVQCRGVLEVVLTSFQPQSLSDLKAMGLLEMARRLPVYGQLLLERENKLHLLHRSIAEWLLEPGHGAVHARSGHEKLAAHIWDTALQPWLLPSSSSSSSQSNTGSMDISREPSTGSYSLKYAVDHLREAGRFQHIQAIIFRLSWLQAMLREKGLTGLIKDMLSLRDHPTLAAAKKKLVAVLRLSSSALFGNDAYKCLPAQLLGRLRETEEDPLLQSLRRESNLTPVVKWLKPLKSSLKPPGNLEITMIGHEDDVLTAIALLDGRLVSCSKDKTLRIWNTTTGDCETVLRGHSDWVLSVIVLSDGRLISCSGDRTLRIWNATTGDCEIVLTGHEDWVRSVIATPDGRLVSCSKDKTLRIWNTSTGDCEAVLSGHERDVVSVIALPGGLLVSCSRDNTLRVWNYTTGDCETVLRGHEDYVLSVIAIPDGRLVSCSRDNTLRVWNATTGVCATVLRGHEGWVMSVIAIPDGRLVSCSNDKNLRIWNATTGDCVAVLKGHEDGVGSVVALPAGQLISSSADRTLRVWNATTGDCEAVLRGHEYGVESVIALPDGQLVSCSRDTTLRIWNTTIDCEVVSTGHDGCIRSVVTLPDGRLVSCSEDYTLRIWNTTMGHCENVLRGHEGEVLSVIALPDGRLVSCSEDRTARVWNTIMGYCETVLTGHEGWVRSIVALHDGRLVSCSEDKTLRVWNATTGDCVAVLRGHDGGVVSVIALLDGRLVSRDWCARYRLWSPLKEEGFLVQSISEGESDSLLKAASSAVGTVQFDRIAAGYSVSSNCLISESFGRVFLDGPVDWVLQVGDLIAVLQSNGRDHWFRVESN